MFQNKLTFETLLNQSKLNLCFVVKIFEILYFTGERGEIAKLLKIS